jgi:1,4-dihydroxy-2-naphthoyl-CoA hydrolase
VSADIPAVDRASASPFVAATGFQVGEVGGTRVTGTVQVGPEQHTPWGVVHGGLYCAVIESAASIGASVAVAEGGQFAVGVNNNTDFVRPMTTGRIEVVAEPIQQGRTL